MNAIILADDSRLDLSPLTDRIPHPLLPVAGKPLLMHALELLHRGSIRRVEVVSPRRHRELAAALDTGPLLGMDISFVPDASLATGSETPCVVIGLANLPDIDWKQTLEGFAVDGIQSHMPIRMTVSARPVALLLPPRNESGISDDWADIHMTEAARWPVEPCKMLATHSLAHYFQANLQLVRGEFDHLRPGGRECMPGHRAGPRARFNSASVRSRNGYFGTGCLVEKTASLDGQVVIGQQSVIGKGARVTDSVILDNTYVGANTDVSGAIVDRNLFIKIDAGIAMTINDPILFGSTA